MIHTFRLRGSKYDFFSEHIEDRSFCFSEGFLPTWRLGHNTIGGLRDQRHFQLDEMAMFKIVLNISTAERTFHD